MFELYVGGWQVYLIVSKTAVVFLSLSCHITDAAYHTLIVVIIVDELSLAEQVVDMVASKFVLQLCSTTPPPLTNAQHRHASEVF